MSHYTNHYFCMGVIYSTVQQTALDTGGHETCYEFLMYLYYSASMNWLSYSPLRMTVASQQQRAHAACLHSSVNPCKINSSCYIHAAHRLSGGNDGYSE
jgi:hypothetical protein